MTSSNDAPQRDLYAELGRAWGKTNLGDHDSVQIFLMCFDALWPQIMALRAAPPRNEPHNHEGPAGSEPKPAPGLEFDARGVLVQNDKQRRLEGQTIEQWAERAKISEQNLADYMDTEKLRRKAELYAQSETAQPPASEAKFSDPRVLRLSASDFRLLTEAEKYGAYASALRADVQIKQKEER